MKLYEFERAPNPRRVRFFIAEKGIDLDSLERVQIDIGAAENRTCEFRQMANALAERTRAWAGQRCTSQTFVDLLGVQEWTG